MAIPHVHRCLGSVRAGKIYIDVVRKCCITRAVGVLENSGLFILTFGSIRLIISVHYHSWGIL